MRLSYDVFLSHNRAEKDWVRDLAARLAEIDYNGRSLRPWLDEQVIDPGEPRKEELSSALDRSRFLAIVLSPSSVASSWVDFELRHFIERRGKSAVLALLKEKCDIPGLLDGVDLIDFTDAGQFEAGRKALVASLCPAGTRTTEATRHVVEEAMREALRVDPGGLWPDPTGERDAVLAELLKADIDELDAEGAAVAGFAQAASHVARLGEEQAEAAYNMKMLLGDCVAAAIRRSAGYRQVAQRTIDLEPESAADPVLSFSVIRAISKLAELGPDQVDASTLLRVASRLDAGPPSGPARAIGVLIGRVLGKIRNGDLGQLLIKALSEMGTVSRIAVCSALAMKDVRADSVYYVSDLAHAAARAEEQGPTALEPPSPRLLSLLSMLSLHGDGLDPVIEHAVEIAKHDLRKAYRIDDFPYPHLWLDVTRARAPAHAHNAPFGGRVVRADANNMVALAGTVRVSDVVVLTEPRVIDALFDHAGAILVADPDLESAQCRRLRGRSMPFATVDAEMLAGLLDNDHLVIEQGHVLVMKAQKIVRQ